MSYEEKKNFFFPTDILLILKSFFAFKSKFKKEEHFKLKSNWNWFTNFNCVLITARKQIMAPEYGGRSDAAFSLYERVLPLWLKMLQNRLSFKVSITVCGIEF